MDPVMTVSPVPALFAKARFPYRYGIHDCCTDIADCVLPHYGKDLMERFRGRYDSEAGLRRLLVSEKCQTLAEAVELAVSDHGLKASEETRDWAIGMVAVSFDGESVELPAFAWKGKWHARSPDGVLVVERAHKIWLSK